MNTVQDKTSYWKQVGLVIMGAILGSAPLQISTYMQSKSQSRKDLFNRRMDALKDYVVSVNEVLTGIIPQLNKVDSELSEFLGSFESQVEITQRGSTKVVLPKQPVSRKVDLSKQKALYEDLVMLDKQLNALRARTNTQEVGISVLFHYNFPPQPPLARLSLSLLERSFTRLATPNPTFTPEMVGSLYKLRDFVTQLREGQYQLLQVHQDSIRQLAQEIGNP